MARPTNALIVDDEAHVRMFLRLLLKELGVAAMWEAGDGATAVDLTVRNKPEVVLLDINMPVMSGLEALAQIRALEPDIPVIMVTTQSALGSVHEAARLGASGYVLKHLPKKEALKAIGEALDALDAPDGAPAE
jgi:two-component system, chemotaxis family, chemotaxis protein CheY